LWTHPVSNIKSAGLMGYTAIPFCGVQGPELGLNR
jgi:hypothetical protein